MRHASFAAQYPLARPLGNASTDRFHLPTRLNSLRSSARGAEVSSSDFDQLRDARRAVLELALRDTPLSVIGSKPRDADYSDAVVAEVMPIVLLNEFGRGSGE